MPLRVRMMTAERSFSLLLLGKISGKSVRPDETLADGSVDREQLA